MKIVEKLKQLITTSGNQYYLEVHADYSVNLIKRDSDGWMKHFDSVSSAEKWIDKYTVADSFEVEENYVVIFLFAKRFYHVNNIKISNTLWSDIVTARNEDEAFGKAYEMAIEEMVDGVSLESKIIYKAKL